MLRKSTLPKKAIFNLARELIGNSTKPQAYGCSSQRDIPQERGSRQGSPESGLLFVSTLNQTMEPLRHLWQQRGDGCTVNGQKVPHMIFVDDLILLTTTPASAKKMITEVVEALDKIGLQCNHEKTAFITTNNTQAQMLPGKDASKEGMRILGRTFAIEENTDKEISRKIGEVWGKFARLRRVLTTPHNLEHRLAVFKACIGQSLLWASESWIITRKRLQRLRGMELKMLKMMIPRIDTIKAFLLEQQHQLHKAHVRETTQKLGYYGLDREWVKKFYNWAGHLARLPGDRWAQQAQKERPLKWWRHQQTLEGGARHRQRRGNISRWEAILERHHPQHSKWSTAATDRELWKDMFPVFEMRVFGENHPHDFGKNRKAQQDLIYREILEPTEARVHGPRKRKPDQHPGQGVPRKKCRTNTVSPGKCPKARNLSTSEQKAKWERELDMPLAQLTHLDASQEHGQQRRRTASRQQDCTDPEVHAAGSTHAYPQAGKGRQQHRHKGKAERGKGAGKGGRHRGRLWRQQ